MFVTVIAEAEIIHVSIIVSFIDGTNVIFKLRLIIYQPKTRLTGDDDLMSCPQGDFEGHLGRPTVVPRAFNFLLNVGIRFFFSFCVE